MNWDKAIFLAHASEDKERVRKLYRTLKENGLEPWLDEEDLMPGVKWDDKIKEAIKNARFFMACLSKHSVTKNGYIQKELRLALNELEQKSPDVIYFIPALIDNVELPNITVGTIGLRDYQAVKIFDENGLDKLIHHLQKQANIISKIKKKENPNFQDLRHSISKGQIETALRLLMEIVKDNNDDLYNTCLLISSRYNRVSKENILGIITRENYTMETNQIVYSILEIIKILEERENYN